MFNKTKSQVRNRDHTNSKTQPVLQKKNSSCGPWAAKVITLFPEVFPGTLGCSVLGRALRENIWSLEVLNLRDFGLGKHKDVDSTPSGGGPGMVLKPDVVDSAIIAATKNISLKEENWPIIYLSPRGQPLAQNVSKKLTKMNGIVILCGRFEGIDQRVIDKWNMWEISLGDFILTGGEIAAQALIDSIVRNIPNVLGNDLSIKNESFSDGLLEHPQYTKPSNWNGQIVPKILLSGNHKKVKEWQNQKSIEVTKSRRPDLFSKSKKK